jgi:hypothetical protein
LPEFSSSPRTKIAATGARLDRNRGYGRKTAPNDFPGDRVPKVGVMGRFEKEAAIA